MAMYHDDNYGWYETESQDDIDFYHATQAKSVSKKCRGCGRTVRIKPEYAYCNRCADRLEQGLDVD